MRDKFFWTTAKLILLEAAVLLAAVTLIAWGMGVI